jgi:transaldolase
MYVEELIGPDTVDTMPEETIKAYQDHGNPEVRLDKGLEEAHRVFDELAKAGIDYDDVTDTLEREGVEKFADSFDELMKALRDKQESLAPA